MKILVTGANGFIGRNLISELRNNGYTEIFQCNRETDISLLETYTEKCDFVFHLAGVNRPLNNNEFMDVNYGFTNELLNLLKKNNNKSPILYTSSIQADNENLYGISKRASERLFFEYEKETGTKVYVYRLSNLFGKWSKPNYNSVVATYCYNIARGIDIDINNSNPMLNLCYIDDVLIDFISTLKNKVIKKDAYYAIQKTYSISLVELANEIKSFKEIRRNLNIPSTNNELVKKLYSTYLSFLPENQFSYKLNMNKDNRGSFTEFIKTIDRGQVSVNISKAGIVKGNHWHHTKNEKFLVVSGKGVIRFRRIDFNDVEDKQVIEYYVSGDELEVIDIPPGYTHNIENIGDSDMVTIMWANEFFNSENPDTYFEGV